MGPDPRKRAGTHDLRRARPRRRRRCAKDPANLVPSSQTFLVIQIGRIRRRSGQSRVILGVVYVVYVVAPRLMLQLVAKFSAIGRMLILYE